MAKIEIIDPTPVYSPAEDSWLLEECILKEDLKSMKCLDFGCGEGIQSIAMFKAGAKSVLAVDVNKNALRVTLQKVGEFLQKKRKIEPKNVEDIFSSHINSRKVKIETAEPVGVEIDGEVVAKTPIIARVRQKALKIITNRGKVE